MQPTRAFLLLVAALAADELLRRIELEWLTG